MRAQLEGDSRSIVDRHRTELEALRREMSSALSSKDRDCEEKLEALRSELARLKEAHAAEIRDLEKRLAELSSGADSSRSALEAELEAMRAELRRKLEEARQESEELVAKLSADHKKVVTDLTEKQSVTLSELRETLGKSHQERMDDMRQKKEKEVEDLKASHASQMASVTTTHEALVKQLRSEHASAVEGLQKTVREAAEQHASAMQQVSDELAASLASARGLQQELQRVQEELEAIRQRFHAAEKSHAETLKVKEDFFNSEKQHLKRQHKGHLEELLADQLRETAEIKEQFDRARALQDMQLKMLHERLAELQDLYDNRPSREEDLVRMMELEADVADKDATIKRLIEEMKFYKLELHNRENNYNKVFGAQPSVGIMNPLAANKASKAGPQVRVLQPPGGDMGGMGIGMGGLPPLGGPPAPGSRKMQKRPSSGSIRRNSSQVE